MDIKKTNNLCIEIYSNNSDVSNSDRYYISDNSTNFDEACSDKNFQEQQKLILSLSDNRDVIIMNDNLADNLLIIQDTYNVMNTKRKKTEPEVNCIGNKQFKSTINFNKVAQSNRNRILQPAKLIVNDKPSHVQPVTATNSPILCPSKLTYVTTKQCLRKRKNNDFTNKNIPLGRNVFMSTNNTNNYKEQMLHKKNVALRENIKKQKLFGTVEHLDFYVQAEMRSTHLKPQCKYIKQSILSSANTKQISKTTNNKKANKISSEGKPMINLPIFSQNAPSDTPQCSNISLPDTTLQSLPIPATKSQHRYQNASSNAILESFNAGPSCVVKTIEAATSRPTIANATAPLNVSYAQAEIGFNNFSSSNHADHIDPNLIKPSTSTKAYHVHDTNQVVAGTKKKEINYNRKKRMLASNFQYIYDKLVLVFPDVDITYVKQMWEQYLDKKNIPLTEQLEELIELILENKELHLAETDIKDTCQKEVFDQDEKYAYLSEMFPNADPEYLKTFLAQAGNDPSAITEFVQTQCKHPTYPTKEEILQKERVKLEKKQYTKNFNIKQFLKIIPDPFTKFENPNRKCTYNFDAFHFLKSYFNEIEVDILRNVYELNMYHLTLTAEALENMRPKENLNKNMCLLKTNLSEDIPLLQECAFIMHKKTIREYLDKVKDVEIKEFENLKKRNELLQCQCCYNDECMPSQCSTCTDGHIFCNSCILRGTESMLAQGKTRISCFTDCNEEFNLSTLQKVLSPKQFNVLVNKKQEAEIISARLEGLLFCPFCHFAYIPPAEDKIFKCLNSECMKETCRFCKKLNHIPLKCHEEESNKARLFVEEKMTEALVRKCYKCSRSFFKEDGCNLIRCPCGVVTCYLCGKIIESYKHFDNGVCELWSTTSLINAHTVQVVAKKTIQYIKKKNPDVTINENGLLAYLPETPSTSNLAVSERIQKLTEFDKYDFPRSK